MFDEMNSNNDNITIRIKNGIPFLSCMAHLLLDVAGPDEVEDFQEMSAKLVRLSENQHADLKYVKKTIKHDHSTIVNMADQIKSLTSASHNITNEIKAIDKITFDMIDTDILYLLRYH